jgi:hypothetical protein
MSAPSVLTQAPKEVPAAPSDLRLHGRWLLLARVGWGALAAVFVGLYVASLPPYVAFLQTPCGGVACAIDGALTPAGMRTLHRLGLSLGSYSALFAALYGLRVLVGCAIGGMIFWRRSEDGMALFVALFLITTTFDNRNTAPDVLPLANAAWWLPVHLGHLLASALLYLFFYLFPTGRVVPRWTGWVAAVYILQQLGELVLPPASPVNLENWPFVLGVLFYLPLFLTVLWAQVYRYRRVSTPAQRQQTKWVVFGVIVVAGGLFGASSLLVIFPALQQSPNPAYVLSGLVLLNLPVVLLACIGVAVLRSRLFDIDVILNRALVYGTLTFLLAALYFGVVVGVQALVGTVNREAARSPVIIVASTLLIAALFNPLRRGIQATIDRRFYRRKYDATRTLAAFGASVRHEVERGQVRERLLAVVQETMQPAHAALWLRPPQRHEGWRIQADAGALIPQSAGRRPRDDDALAP